MNIESIVTVRLINHNMISTLRAELLDVNKDMGKQSIDSERTSLKYCNIFRLKKYWLCTTVHVVICMLIVICCYIIFIERLNWSTVTSYNLYMCFTTCFNIKVCLLSKQDELPEGIKAASKVQYSQCLKLYMYGINFFIKDRDISERW